MAALDKRISLLKEEGGSAVVEAAILFPFIFMIFFGLAILALYLPTRSALQYATQYAANAIATERSDTWVCYDESSMSYQWLAGRAALKQKKGGVYKSFLGSFLSGSQEGKAIQIVEDIEKGAATYKAGNLEIHCFVNNCIVYKEVVVSAKRAIPSPINLSALHFPLEIPISVSSTAVVQNGDEFIRDVDLAVDVVERVSEKYESVGKIFKAIEKVTTKFTDFLKI